jgi:hypothetical protein
MQIEFTLKPSTTFGYFADLIPKKERVYDKELRDILGAMSLTDETCVDMFKDYELAKIEMGETITVYLTPEQAFGPDWEDRFRLRY